MRVFRQLTAKTVDAAMCAAMVAFQQRHKLDNRSRDALTDYIAAHRGMTRDEYFQAQALSPTPSSSPSSLNWASPITTAFPENNVAHVDLYPSPIGWSAPTVIFLHALMSASDNGYRRWAARFNSRGWNACFVHLPFHYSRKPRGYRNGELAITADLVRTSEGLRQGVSEIRQLMAFLRERGGREFGLWASSYGGWIGALLASVEKDFRFAALLEPIVNVDHAIWISPAGAAVRQQLRTHQIEAKLVNSHYHLTSPFHAQPAFNTNRTVLVGGCWDSIARLEDVERLHQYWRGSELLRVEQGHFGYRMMPALWEHLNARGFLDESQRESSDSSSVFSAND